MKIKDNLSFIQIQIRSICWIIIVLAVFGCKNGDRNEIEVSDKVVLKIGNLEITRYEFEKRKSAEVQNFKAIPGGYKNWLNEYIDNAYLTCDAYEKKMDTISTSRKTILYATMFMVGQVKGYVWENTQKDKLKFTKAELKDAYDQRKVIYYMEYLAFPDETSLNILGNDTLLKNEGDFERIVDICKKDKKIRYYYDPIQWPFGEMFGIKDILVKLKPGDVVGPLRTLKGNYIVHFIQTEQVKQRPFVEEKILIENILRRNKTDEIVEAKQREIKNYTKYSIDNNIVNELTGFFSKANNDSVLPGKDLIEKTIMTYYLKGEKLNLTIKEYTDYITLNPFLFNKINSFENHSKNLGFYAMGSYYMLVADSIGIFRDKQFILDEKNFRNSLVLQDYIKTEFENKIAITPEECLEFYNKNTQYYKQGKTADVTFLNFGTIQAAEQNVTMIQTLLKQSNYSRFTDTSLLKGLFSYKLHEQIESDNKEYNQEIISSIFNNPAKVLNGPLAFKDQNLIYFKNSESGARIKPFEEVKELIYSQLQYYKMNELKKKRIQELKAKYKITVNKLD